jgi:lipid-A-disaccharide synthase
VDLAELARHLPIFLKAFQIFQRHFPRSRAFVFAARGLPDSAYNLSDYPHAEIIRESDYKIRSQLDAAICSSGTATLENALLGIPMAVAYKISWPTYFLARAIIRVPHIAMANILAGKELVPELIQNQAAPEPLARALVRLMEDLRRYTSLKKELAGLRILLGHPGVSERVARALLSELLKDSIGAARQAH